jgi:hypothetical protein
MLVLHIRDFLFRFRRVVVDIRSFIRLIGIFDIALHPLFILILVILILIIGFLPLLVQILILLVAMLGLLRLFVFLIVHTTLFRPLRILLSFIPPKKPCHAP